ncbi:MAG: HD domain-containing protein [Clostridiales bacterium]|jgi:uncharacterized protein|nr:HD domain-containing protein [Clostridiales bacterium]
MADSINMNDMDDMDNTGKPERHIDAVRADPRFAQMLEYVKARLATVASLDKSGKPYVFRSRFGHTERVLEWALRIRAAEAESAVCGSDNKNAVGDAEILTAAAIFHDVGYCVAGKGHAKIGAEIFLEYARQNRPFADEGTTTSEGLCACAQAVAEVIAAHSDKQLGNGELPPETRILMDADLLDEAGAMSLVWDCFTEAGQPVFDFDSAYERILRTYARFAASGPNFHTRAGLRLHGRMCRYVRAFLEGYAMELNRAEFPIE